MRCCVVVVIACALSSLCVDARKIRGISLSYKRFYRERKSFLCIDGSKMIPFEQVNDDYCDCEDGSDEPGTAACPNGRFYCINLGFHHQYIPSSRVNDGICDCCDASDEYNSHTRCLNTCRNLGQRERAAVEDQMRALDEGLRLRQQLIEEGVLLWREKQGQLRELQQVAEDLQVKLEEHRGRRRRGEYAEPGGPRAPPPPPGAQDDAEVRDQNTDATSLFHLLDSDNDGSITADEVRAKVASLQNAGRELSENEARDLLGGVNQIDFPAFQDTLWHTLRRGDTAKIKEPRGGPESLAEEGGPTITAAQSAAERAAEELRKVEEAYEIANTEISDLKEKLNTDYGPEREFLYLSTQCYQLRVYDEYTYTLCPFNQVSQTSDVGTEFLLGKWGEWAESLGSEYSRMRYESGEPCLHGPTRNTLVTLTCALETALRSVREPGRCQYIMDLDTPAACRPARKQKGIHSEL
ncbi:unnamed protein product [Merluccius merluccius]